jgi:dTMP kinase
MAYFITVEGIDGAGKSTHLEFIQNYLNKKNIQNKLTREPGGTDIGEKLRLLLLHDEMDVGTETMMMFAARHEHIISVIQPALKSNISIVCDRFTDATYAYQQGGKGIDPSFIKSLEQLVHPDLTPDLTFLFDLDPEAAHSRISHERDLDKFEKQSLTFFNGVRKIYLELAKGHSRFHVIDSSQTIEQIQDIISIKLDELVK